MATVNSKIRLFVLYSIIPIVCSVVVGFIFYQGDVFDRHHGAFQFVWSGVFASLFYSLLLFARSRDAYLGLIGLFALTFVTTRSTLPSYILRDILYAGAIALSILVFFRYFRKGSHIAFLYPAFTLAGIYGTVYVVMAEIHLSILQSFAMLSTGGTYLSVATATAFFGVLIGFGVGFGFALSARLFPDAH